MNLCSIASGSSGNCIYIGNENTSLLVDAGISGKRMEQGLCSIDVNPEKINGILVTHEHVDHVSGLGVMARKYQIPIYATIETIYVLCHMKSMGNIPEGLFHIVEPDKTYEIQDIIIEPFSISHDAANPVCYTLISNGHKAGVATDLGKYDDYIISHLKGSELLLLEANHDINMLQVGSYPYLLKRRILGDMGHLSNDNSGRLISHLLHKNLKHIFLGHLSKDNNYPELAYETVRWELRQSNAPFFDQCSIKVASREIPSAFVSV